MTVEIRKLAPGVSGLPAEDDARVARGRRAAIATNAHRVEKKKPATGHQICKRCGRPWVARPSGRRKGYHRICSGCDLVTDSCSCVPVGTKEEPPAKRSDAPPPPGPHVALERVVERAERLLDRIEDGLGSMVGKGRG